MSDYPTLAEIRKDVAKLLADELGIPGHAGPQTNVNPPCLVVQPHPTNDYLEAAAIGSELVRHQVVLLVKGGGDPIATLAALEAHLDRLRPILQWRKGQIDLNYVYGPVSPPGQFTVGAKQIPGVSMDVTATRPVGRPEDYPS